MKDRIFITSNHDNRVSENAKEIPIDSIIRIEKSGLVYSISVVNGKIRIYNHEMLEIKPETIARNQIEI